MSFSDALFSGRPLMSLVTNMQESDEGLGRYARQALVRVMDEDTDLVVWNYFHHVYWVTEFGQMMHDVEDILSHEENLDVGMSEREREDYFRFMVFELVAFLGRKDVISMVEEAEGYPSPPPGTEI